MADKYLTGLLAPPGRECLRGHGAMVQAEGTFALTGVNPEKPTAALHASVLRYAATTFRPNGQVYALKVWRCPTCGFVELVDQE